MQSSEALGAFTLYNHSRLFFFSFPPAELNFRILLDDFFLPLSKFLLSIKMLSFGTPSETSIKHKNVNRISCRSCLHIPHLHPLRCFLFIDTQALTANDELSSTNIREKEKCNQAKVPSNPRRKGLY